MAATALPSSGGPAPEDAGCDTEDLVFVHDAFRRLYSVMPTGIRRTPPGDPKRVAAVARGVAMVGDALHHHHHLEDEYYWGPMETRRPACTPHVELMKQHHARVAALLDAAAPLSDAWTTRPGVATAEAFAAHVEEIGALLRLHLAREEELALPVMGEVFSQSEWDAVGEEAQKAYDRSQIFLFFGIIQDSLSPDRLDAFIAEVPAAIRILYRLIGRRQYEKSLELLSAGTARPGHYDAEALRSAL